MLTAEGLIKCLRACAAHATQNCRRKRLIVAVTLVGRIVRRFSCVCPFPKEVQYTNSKSKPLSTRSSHFSTAGAEETRDLHQRGLIAACESCGSFSLYLDRLRLSFSDEKRRAEGKMRAPLAVSSCAAGILSPYTRGGKRTS